MKNLKIFNGHLYGKVDDVVFTTNPDKTPLLDKVRAKVDYENLPKKTKSLVLDAYATAMRLIPNQEPNAS